MTITSTLAATAAAGSAIAGGVYANFSARVMPRLAALPDAEGIATMQHFNRVAVRLPFMTVFFGTAALSTALVAAAGSGGGEAALLRAGGAGLYLAGFAMTIGYHVPRNERLARVRAGTAQGGAVWRHYQDQWTPANTVRAALSLLGAAALAAGAVLP